MADRADDSAVDLARRMVGLPMRRLRLFGLNAVNDVQWDMLLQLLIAERDGDVVPISALQIGSGAPIEDARRSIRELTERRLITIYDAVGTEAATLTLTARVRVERALIGEPRGEEVDRPDAA